MAQAVQDNYPFSHLERSVGAKLDDRTPSMDLRRHLDATLDESQRYERAVGLYA